MKQTAVQWFFDELYSIRKTIPFRQQADAILKAFEQAKAMEKGQIMDAREDGHLSTYAEYGSTPKCYLDGGHEQYYNETFKSE